MQQLAAATIRAPSAERCAAGLLAAVPHIMRFIRCQMGRHRRAELTVPQFRALVFLSLNDEASLSAMAEHLGLSLPAASRLVALLVKRGLMRRRVRLTDRRCVRLSLTGRGQAVFRAALKATEVALARRFKVLSAGERGVVSEAMDVLARVFSPEGGEGRPEE